MSVKLVLLSAVSAALYLALAVVSLMPAEARPSSRWLAGTPFTASLEFWVIWGMLAITYMWALKLAVALGSRKSRASVVFVVGAAVLFRGLLLWLGSGFDGASREAFLHASSPLEAFGRDFLSDLTTRRLVAVGFDLAAVVIAPALLRGCGVPAILVMVHAWNPLAVVESAGYGRLEIGALFFLLWSLERAHKGHRWVASVAYGLCLSGPLLLAAAVPVMARVLRAHVVVSLAIGLAAWRYGASAASFVSRIGWPPADSVGGSLSPIGSVLAGLLVTRSAWLVTLAMLGLWCLIAVYRAALLPSDANARHPRETLVLVGSFLFVAPSVLPWAFLVLAYLGAHSGNRGWVLFTLTAPVGYAAMASGGWGWNFWSGFAQYFAPYAALVFWWLGSPPSRRTTAG